MAFTARNIGSTHQAIRVVLDVALATRPMAKRDLTPHLAGVTLANPHAFTHNLRILWGFVWGIHVVASTSCA